MLYKKTKERVPFLFGRMAEKSRLTERGPQKGSNMWYVAVVENEADSCERLCAFLARFAQEEDIRLAVDRYAGAG